MNKPPTLSVQFDNIPMDLKRTPRWVMWRFVEIGDEETKRWSKLPMQVNGQPASSTNPQTWADFLTVQQAYTSNPNRFDGVGFVFSDHDNLVGIDLDDCYDADHHVFTDAALQHIANSVTGYMEVSPSGTGVKIFTRATMHSAHVDHDKGLECYPKGRYFTVTGHILSGTIPATEQDLTDIIPERTIRRTGDAFADYTPPVEGYDLHRVETEILAQLDPSTGYTDWLSVGMALHHQFGADYEALELWDRWSYGDGFVPNYAPTACDKKWSTFKGSGATLRSLIFKINQHKRQEALDNGEIILDSGVMNHARTFLDNFFVTEEGYRIVHYADDFYVHAKTHYEVIEEQTIRSQLYMFLDRCKKAAKGGALVPFNPSPASVSAAVDATKSITHLPNIANTRPPIWLEQYRLNKPEASKLVSLQNGIFHLEDRVLIPHSLGFFTQNSLPFDYDEQATCPIWEKFLGDVWPDDQESIDTLQEMFGYILSGDTRQQKFFNIIGPRRSGKGTINKVLVALLGQHNTVAPQLEELCDSFGLQPWLGKLLASFTDARAPERNRSAVVSQLLRIVGGDTVTVNRKNKESWNGYLPTRIVIYSNEVLQLTENSNALTGRMIVLKMIHSFYDKEDADLSYKLSKELSGIFNWAMKGLERRLERGGHFVQPNTGKEYLELMSELGNPIGTFAEEALIFDPSAATPKDEVFACYKHWATKKNIPYGTELAFKRRFLAAVQEHNILIGLDRTNGNRVHLYKGVKLNEKAQRYVDTNFMPEEGVF